MLVLIPLLGFTYLITIAGPTDKLSLAYYVFNHVRALLLSIQVSSEFCLAVGILDLSLQTSYMYLGRYWLSWLSGYPGISIWMECHFIFKLYLILRLKHAFHFNFQHAKAIPVKAIR